jgi:cellulose synthase/poly-beta-1,6-N-acetylglucosamine synthase-like glycosyltransferase
MQAMTPPEHETTRGTLIPNRETIRPAHRASHVPKPWIRPPPRRDILRNRWMNAIFSLGVLIQAHTKDDQTCADESLVLLIETSTMFADSEPATSGKVANPFRLNCRPKMTLLEIAILPLFLYVLAWAAYVVAMPVSGHLRARRGRSATPNSDRTGQPNVVVIVPAHDAEQTIVSCIKSIKQSQYSPDKLSILIVADHCADQTIALAESENVGVLVRDENPAGKTYSIAWALNRLSSNEHLKAYDLYLIVDSTAKISAGFIEHVAEKWRHGEDVIVGKAVVDRENQKWFAQCTGLTLTHRSLQNRSRERLGLSSLIEGRGMAYSREYIKRFGWTLAVPDSTSGNHPTEDWRHGVLMVQSGVRAAFADDAVVYTPLRGTLRAATQQGVRWERGRSQNASTNAIRVLKDGFLEANALKFFAGLDAVQPPVAVLAGMALMAFIAAVGFAQSSVVLWVGVAPLFFVGLYGLLVIFRGRRDGIQLLNLAWAPAYIGWRCFAFLLARVPQRGRAQS